MKFVFLGIGAMAASVVAGSATAQPIACGEVYTVVAGDSLQTITDRAYGPGRTFKKLYRANRGVIGDDPAKISIGWRLRAPCPDAPDAPDAPRDSADAPAAPDTGVIRIVTASGWPPFIDEGQAQGKQNY